MVKYYEVNESQLASKAIEKEAIYYCSDTGNIYFDSILSNTRTKMSNTIIILNTESQRTNILAPIPDKIYAIIDSGSMYIYHGGVWVRFSGYSQFQISNVVVENGTSTISDSRINSLCTAKFVPDLSVIDLATDISCKCSAGSVTVKLTSSYPITGNIYIN